MDVDIERTADGLRVRDRNGREHCRLGVDDCARLRTADETAAGITTGRFPVPVSAAVECLGTGLTLPDCPVVIRDRDGEYVGRVDDIAFRTFTEGRYLLELHGAVHCVVGFEAGFTLGPDCRQVTFDRESPIRLGARSARPRPTETVTTTDDPADVMAAVSTFGSALATRAPERSFPAYREHPPALELGDELHVPDGLEPPENGVTIELPSRLEYAYAAAPLAAYLGATVEPGRRAQLRTDAFSYSLSGRGGVEESLARVLKQVFVLDVACRGAGSYPGESDERRVVDAAVDLDWDRLSDADPVDRLEAYLSVPFHAVRDAIPRWGTSAHVQPEPENVTVLPSLVARFATVQSPPTVSSHRRGRSPDPVDTDARTADGTGAPTRPEPTDAVEDVWVGDGAPLGATKGLEAGYSNRFERSPPVAGDAESPARADAVAVLAPSPDRRAEAETVAEAYADPELAVGLTRADLRRRLAEERTLLHLVGDVSEEGFGCVDGALDATGVDAVGCDAFVLDTCTAHGQATSLVEAGALGGIAAFHEQPGADATEVGETLARLLERGFPLAAAVDVAVDAGFADDGFLVVGDGTTTVAGTGTRPPMALTAESLASGYAVRSRGYPADTAGMGGRVRSALDGAWTLTAARRTPETLDAEAFETLLREAELPVVLDGGFVRPTGEASPGEQPR